MLVGWLPRWPGVIAIVMSYDLLCDICVTVHVRAQGIYRLSNDAARPGIHGCDCCFRTLLDSAVRSAFCCMLRVVLGPALHIHIMRTKWRALNACTERRGGCRVIRSIPCDGPPACLAVSSSYVWRARTEAGGGAGGTAAECSNSMVRVLDAAAVFFIALGVCWQALLGLVLSLLLSETTRFIPATILILLLL